VQHKTFWIKTLTGLLILLGISSYFTMPAFQGKTLKQYDILQHKGMSKEIEDYRQKGKEIYWTNSMFSGMPAYMISTNYADGPFHHITVWLRQILPHPTALIFLLTAGFFLMMLVLGFDPIISAAGGIAFGFSTYFIVIIGAGHNAKAHSMAFLPPIFAGMLLAYKGKKWIGWSLFGAFFALELKTNHPQMTYYFGFVLLAVAIAEGILSIRTGRFKDFLLASTGLIILLVFALGAHFAYLTTTQEYGKYSIRGGSELSFEKENKTSGLDRDYITQWSNGIDETLSLLIPNFKGGESTTLSTYKKALENIPPTLRDSIGSLNAYWGDQPFTAGPVYAGAFVILLFLFSLITFQNPLKWPLLIVLVLIIMLSWGKNLQTLPLGIILIGLTKIGFFITLNRNKVSSNPQKALKILKVTSIIILVLLIFTLFGPLNDGPKFPLTDWFLDYFPAYNKFRAVASILVIAEFIIPFLALAGIAPFLINPEKFREEANFLNIPLKTNYLNIFLYTSGVLCIILLVFATYPTIFTEFFATGERDELTSQLQSFGLGTGQIEDFLAHLQNARSYMLKQDALRSLLFVFLGSAVLLMTAYLKLKPLLSSLAVCIVIILDLVPINFRYITKENWVDKKRYEKEAIPLTAADESILSDNSPYFRVANLTLSTFNDATTSYRHKSIGGYHGAKLRRYQDIIENLLMPDLEKVRKTFSKKVTMSEVDSVLARCVGLNMLNVKYLILSKESPAVVNKYAAGHAWFVSSIIYASDADEEMLLTQTKNFRNTAVIRKEFSNFLSAEDLKYDSSARVQLLTYHPEKLEYETFSNRDGFLVFSEIYYPEEWHAHVDDKETTIFRTNYILRGINVPAGHHRVTLEFKSKLSERLKISTAFSYILFIFVLGVFLWPLIQNIKNKKMSTHK